MCHHAEVAEATILHADLDAFYAAVEQVLDPSLRGVPMAVGEGVILAASYEARAFGVRSAMPTSSARARCPPLIVVSGSFRRYLEFSEQVMAIFERFTPDIEQISVDEAFLQVAGSIHLLGPPAHMAAEIRSQVRAETGLAVSIGVATTKFLSKVASQVAKPDGLVVVEAGRELEFLAPLPVEILWGVGPKTAPRLAEMGVETVGELAAVPMKILSTKLGRAAAAHLAALATNQDPRPVRRRPRAKSIGSQQALGRGIVASADIDRVVLTLAERVTRRLRDKGRSARTITTRVRFPGGRVVSRSETLAAPVATTEAVGEVARRLAEEARVGEDEPLTLVGVSLSGLVDDAAIQLELGLDGSSVAERAGSARAERAAAIDRQLDEIRRRFGKGMVTRAGLLDSEDRDAPEDFRRLSERD